jgi:hypothetical protein
MTKAKAKQKQREGLIGLFGHTYVADPDDADAQTIQYQFEVVRHMEGGRYVVQLFSFLDGSPTNVSVYTETELLGPNVRLYATAELWNHAYEKDCQRSDRSP